MNGAVYVMEPKS